MKTFSVIFTLFSILIATVALALYIWVGLGYVDISFWGLLAMGGGIVLSLLLGIGLMVLVFYSSRAGHDQNVADLTKKTSEPTKEET